MEKRMNLQYFAENVNVTTDPGLSVENKTFYDRALLEEASPNLIHMQFGQKRPIPKNGGKRIEFRRYAALPKATQPLTEGVTPDGRKMTAVAVEAEVSLQDISGARLQNRQRKKDMLYVMVMKVTQEHLWIEVF